jgi:uncharacterized protein
MRPSWMRRLVCLAALMVLIGGWPAVGLTQTPARPVTPAAASGVRIRVAWPLYYFTRGNKADGMSKRMVVRVEPSDVGDVRVGFFESEFMASGTQWRAAGWMAAVVSALITGQPMSQWRISYDVAGRIDGPSAGGLMTTSVLAAITGRHILPKVTMTGTINPDGTIGPVGGIYYKLHGAQRVGMKKVLIPAGIRTEKLKDGRTVDLYQRAKSLGLVLVEVEDVYQAYFHLTGEPLSQIKDDGRRLDLPAKAKRAVIASYRRWQKVLADRLQRMAQTAKDVPQGVKKGLAQIWRRAHIYRLKAEKAFQAGQVMAATSHCFTAAFTADLGAHLSYLLIALKREGLPGLKRVFKGYLLTGAFLEAFLKRLNSARITNVNDLITVAEAYGYYSVALGVFLRLKEQIKDLDKLTDKKKLLARVLTGTRLTVLARSIFFLTDDILNIGLGHPGPPLPPMLKLGIWSRTMRRASEANLVYLDEAIIDPLAKQFEKLPSFVRSRLLGNDYHYQLSWLSFKAWPVLTRFVPKGYHQAAAVLGGTATSCAFSALVIAKYYSLVVKKDEAGTTIGVARPELLTHMLHSARRQLRLVVLEARARGWTPVIPLLHLTAARDMSGTGVSVSEKINALSDFWMGSTLGRLFLILGRKS